MSMSSPCSSCALPVTMIGGIHVDISIASQNMSMTFPAAVYAFLWYQHVCMMGGIHNNIIAFKCFSDCFMLEVGNPGCPWITYHPNT